MQISYLYLLSIVFTTLSFISSKKLFQENPKEYIVTNEFLNCIRNNSSNSELYHQFETMKTIKIDNPLIAQYKELFRQCKSYSAINTELLMESVKQFTINTFNGPSSARHILSEPTHKVDKKYLNYDGKNCDWEKVTECVATIERTIETEEVLNDVINAYNDKSKDDWINSMKTLNNIENIKKQVDYIINNFNCSLLLP